MNAIFTIVSTVFRVILALALSGLGAALAYGIVFVQPRYYLQLLVITFPVVAFLSVVVGGPLYAVLVKFGVRLTEPICIAAGFALGALPGILLWAVATSPSPNLPMPENLAVENIQLPFIFGAFGAVGGVMFAIVGRALWVR